MARLWSSGIELNWSIEGENSDRWKTTTTTVRSGTYAMHSDGPSEEASVIGHQFSASPSSDGYYLRGYFRISSSVGSQQKILSFASSVSTFKISIRLNTDNTLELWNDEDSVQVGSDSSALSADTWYLIELKVDTTTLASTAIEAKINGTAFASGTVNLAAGVDTIYLGIVEETLQGVLFVDDIALNNDSGSFQNSYPGEGEIIHLRPNATGDNGAWTGSNTDIDEVTPDDATTTISSSVANNLEDVNLDATPAALASDDTINVVQVGVRMQNNSGGTNSLTLRIKASSGGTTEESGNIATATAWNTNATAAPRNYQLTLYDLPGASTTAWTKTDLDAAQIGAKVVTTGQSIRVSTLWLLVDHKPASVAEAVRIPQTINSIFFGTNF